MTAPRPAPVPSRRGIALAALLGAASLVSLVSVGSDLRWPAPLAVRIANDTERTLLVDARWADARFGMRGTIVRGIPPHGAAILHLWPITGICVRVIDPTSRTLAGGFLTEGSVGAGDTVEVAVGDEGRTGVARPRLQATCPIGLLRDRVRLSWGAYFDPAEPWQVRRERVTDPIH